MSRVTEIVASILGVAGAGFRLSLILNAVSCEIANAPAEIHSISKSVTLFSLHLKQTAAVLEQPDSICSNEALRTTEEVLEESNAVFGVIDAMLDRVRTKRQDGTHSPNVPLRIKWGFKKHSIAYLLGRMDRLQMSLALMLQIMQLGRTMASTSVHDRPDRVREMSDRIRRERVEAQNVVVLYFFENQHLDHLYLTAKEEETEVATPMDQYRDGGESDALTLVSSHESQLSKVEEIPLQTGQGLAVQPPTRVLPEFEDTWQRMGRSPEDMLKVSEEIIDRLLDRWTVWRERRGQSHQQPRSKANGRYRTVVHDSPDDEEAFYTRYQDRDHSPAGKFLEGSTKDWRQPHSTEARQKRAQLLKAYAGYQPSVEGSSDREDSVSSGSSKKKPSTRYAIDSDENTSESEEENVGVKPHPRRRSSAVQVPTQPKPQVESTASRSYAGSTARTPTQQPNSSARPSISPTWSQYQPQHRPFASPDQNAPHHAFSTPNPANYAHTAGPQRVPLSGPQSPNRYMPPGSQTYPFPQIPPQPPPPRYPRFGPQSSYQGQPSSRPVSRDGPPSRPASREGRPAKSQSTLSREYTVAEYKAYEAERKRHRKGLKRDISDNAAKGLLAGGGLAVLLEALDAFS